MNRERINQLTLLMLVLFISALFLSMIRHFLMALFLAGIFSAMAYPLYRRLALKFRGRQNLAAAVTLVIWRSGDDKIQVHKDRNRICSQAGRGRRTGS
jgi:predicted PurR-regulated permease PerM